MLDCHTLGPLQVRIDGHRPPPDLVWRKNIGLLLYLVQSPTGAVLRDDLVATFWGTKPPRHGRHSLREALRVVRRHVGPERLSTHGQHLHLSATALNLDLVPFGRYAETKRWVEAAQLVRGDFLEGFDIPDAPVFASWLLQERRHWRVRMLEAVRRTADPLIDAGRTDEAAPILAKVFLVDPNAEDAMNMAARFFALLGARDGVTRTRHAFNGYLSQLGVDPDRMPVDVYDRLRREVIPTTP